ncbi:MAG: methylated-DNA--[protein]-cysteine S-methyltransferase [Acidimicrobiaceae bacterium]|nr:methylated-DNA--[protein]-cysteine S-methyltransferase [Acidimicrobiaceae bacterium]
MFYLKSGATVFQKAVWDEICKIPFASTRSYKEIAISLGRVNSYRAAGNACGANRFALLIPCHRVVSSSGATGHYRWGSKIKARLLSHETASSG